MRGHGGYGPGIEGLRRVGGTDAGGYYEIAPDVLLANPHLGYVQTETGARASLLELHRIARARGRRLVSIVPVDRVKGQDASARRVWKDEIDSNLVCGVALAGSSLLGRAIASFFIGLARPRVQTVMVASVEQAVDWAREQIAERGGPIA